MLNKLEQLYGRKAAAIESEIKDLTDRVRRDLGDQDHLRQLSEKDSILITYADSITNGQEKTFRTLKTFLDSHVGKAVSGVHVLPFYPYSSDDGFSVVDYLAVNEAFGDWSDVRELSKDYDLMFDAVINHISQYSAWYEGFKNGDPAYEDFFIVCNPEEDYSHVVRPRALPLLTPVVLKGEEKYVWTTFSEDQIDLNYANPKVFVKILEVLLTYVAYGAKLIRLDAIGFAWKEIGTTCIHLPQTHMLIQLMREALVSVKEDLVIITETNVPHEENISYFGNGYDEAHMVYQFPLPPLTMHALLTGDGTELSKWADSLEPLSEETTYFNFLASHDGIGLRPVENTLNKDQVQVLLDAVQRNGGRINYKNNSDGSQSPYEMNINYMDGLGMVGDSETLHERRFLAAQAILYSMVGVPGIYIHSLLGSGNDIEGMESSGINRRINREKLVLSNLEEALGQQGRRANILSANKTMLRIRGGEKAFNPFGLQEVVFDDPGILVLRRYSTDGKEKIVATINLTSEEKTLQSHLSGRDLLSDDVYDNETVSLKPYQVRWIKE